MRRFCFFLVLIVFISFGCKQRAVTQPESQPPAQKEAGKGPETVTEKKGGAGESITSKEMDGKTEGKEGMFADVHFDFDKYDIKDADKPTLKNIASWMTKNGSAKLMVEGHCDERGTNEYNLALGDRRAKAVKDYLVSLAVPSAKIETIIYGEEKPLCKEQTEECWAKNRRGHFVVLGKAGK